MKDIKGDKILVTSNEYLKQRNFEMISDVKVKSEDMLDEPVGILPEEQVGLKEILSPSSPNLFTFSTTSSQCNFIDQQYIRLKSWMTEASEPCRSELSQVLFPLFVHLYLELLTGAGKQRAHIFFHRHHQVFLVNRDYEQTLKQVWSAAGETVNSPIIQSFKSGKYIVRLSELTVNYFLRYLQTSNNPTLLQIFNNFLEVEVSELSGSQQTPGFRPPDEARVDGAPQFLGEGAGSCPARVDCSPEELSRLLDLVANAQAMRPLMPSLSVYSVHNASNGLTSARTNRDNRLLVCGFEDSVIKVWRLTPPPQNTVTGFELPQEPRSSESILFCDSFRGDDDECASVLEKEEEEETKGVGGRHISGGEFCTLRGHRGPVFDVAFTHCSSFLFSVGDDAAMRLWDLKQQRTVALYQGHHYPVWCLDVAPQTVYVATGSYDETVRLWTTECTYPLRVFVGHTGSVDSVAFHPNCSYVASGANDRSIRLWQVNDASVARVLLQHSAPIKCLCFSPNGKYLASGSENGEVFIWDLAAGKVITQVGLSSDGASSYGGLPSLQPEDPIMSLDWSKDSRVLFSASSDGYVRGTFFPPSNVGDSSEIETILCASSAGSSSLIHMSLNIHNYLSAIVTVHGER